MDSMTPAPDPYLPGDVVKYPHPASSAGKPRTDPCQLRTASVIAAATRDSTVAGPEEIAERGSKMRQEGLEGVDLDTLLGARAVEIEHHSRHDSSLRYAVASHGA